MKIETFKSLMGDKGGLRSRAYQSGRESSCTIELFGYQDKDECFVLIHDGAKQEFPLSFRFNTIEELETLISTFKEHKLGVDIDSPLV